MQLNLYHFVSITKDWEVWIYLADLLVSIDHD